MINNEKRRKPVAVKAMCEHGMEGSRTLLIGFQSQVVLRFKPPFHVITHGENRVARVTRFIMTKNLKDSRINPFCMRNYICLPWLMKKRVLPDAHHL
jgi:hypothetical protein